jgi:hypothetical protein
MTNPVRPNRIIAAFSGAVEITALLLAVIALFSMGGDGLDKMFAAFVFYVSAPVAVVIGIILGIRSVKSASPWGFARPRQVIISVILAFLLLGFNCISQEMGFIKKPVPLRDPFAASSADHLIKLLSDPQPDNRSRAAEELVHRHYSSAGDLILPLLQDSSASVRGRASVLLGQQRDKRAVDRILMLLNDPDYGTQLDAVRSLGEIGDNRAVEPLLAVFQRPNISGIVAEALAKIGDQRAVGPLIEFLENAKRVDQVQSKNWVISSLEKLSGQKYGTDIARWRQWYAAEGRK